MKMRIILATTLGMLLMVGAWGQDMRILFLSTSERFVHPAIKREGDQLGVAERVLTDLATQMGATVTCTKDASAINGENLKNYDLVAFYTQGDLTKPSEDKTPPMGETGVTELLAWIEQGGGFIGFHSATDSFRSEGDAVSPFTEMIGAEFRSHGAQFEGSVVVVDADHPTMQHVPQNWKLHEEWYLFTKFNTEDMHVLALLDPGEERTKQADYDIQNYPIMWCRSYGQGRVYYTTLAHREDIWTNPTFQQVLKDTIAWALGRGPADADSNYAELVQTAQPPPAEPEEER